MMSVGKEEQQDRKKGGWLEGLKVRRHGGRKKKRTTRGRERKTERKPRRRKNEINERRTESKEISKTSSQASLWKQPVVVMSLLHVFTSRPQTSQKQKCRLL